MRILQLVQKPQRRGAEVFAYQLSDYLRGKGHEVRTIYLYRYDGEKRLELHAGDVAIDADEQSSLEKVPGFQPYVVRRIKAEIEGFRPDIVQVNGSRTIKYGALVKALARTAGWRLVYRNIDSPVFWVKGLAKKWVYSKIIMPRIDGIIGVSEKTLQEVRDFYGTKSMSEFIPNGVDFGGLNPGDGRDQIRAAFSTPTDATVGLFMGNLSSQKRPDRFLRVMRKAMARNGDLYGWLLGDGPDRKLTEQLAVDVGITDRIRFLGYQDNVAPYIDAADFYVSTSDTEGIPAVVIEVGYLGKPTVGMRVGGMHECVRHGKTGILVEAGDESGLVDAITRLSEDATYRETLGHCASDFSRNTFSMNRVGEGYESFFVRLLGAHSVTTH